jgi:Sap-like sulfolipid-1-addressing protein
MCSSLLLLSLLAAIDPVRIGITALLIVRKRPILNLLTFWLGGLAGGVAAAVAILLFLRDFTLGVMRAVVSATSSPIVTYLQVAVGALAVSWAALLLNRLGARKRSTVPATAPVGLQEPVASSTPVRLSMRDRLNNGSLSVAFVAGVALATPPVEYMAAILAIVASTPTAPAQVGAALLFTVVAFAVVEVPLVTYFTAPAQTLAVVRRINDWITERRQAIPIVVVGAMGFMLLVSGMGNA